MPTRSMMEKMPKKPPEPTPEEVFEAQCAARDRLRPPPTDGLRLEAYFVRATRETPAPGESTAATTPDKEEETTGEKAGDGEEALEPSSSAKDASGGGVKSKEEDSAPTTKEPTIHVDDVSPVIMFEVLEGEPVRGWLVAPRETRYESSIERYFDASEAAGVRCIVSMRPESDEARRFGYAALKLTRIKPTRDEDVAYEFEADIETRIPRKSKFPLHVDFHFELLANGRHWQQVVEDLAILPLDEELRTLDRIFKETQAQPMMPEPVSRLLRGVVHRPLDISWSQTDDEDDHTVAVAIDVRNAHATRNFMFCDADFYFDPDQDDPPPSDFEKLEWRWTRYESPPILLRPGEKHRVTALVVAVWKNEQKDEDKDKNTPPPKQKQGGDEKKKTKTTTDKKKEQPEKKKKKRKPPKEYQDAKIPAALELAYHWHDESNEHECAIVNGTHWITWTPRIRLEDLDPFDARRLPPPPNVSAKKVHVLRDPTEPDEPRRYFENVKPDNDEPFFVIPTGPTPFNLGNPGAPIPRRFFDPPPFEPGKAPRGGFARAIEVPLPHEKTTPTADGISTTGGTTTSSDDPPHASEESHTTSSK